MEFSTVLQLVKQQKWDDEKNKTLEILCKNINTLSGNDVTKLMNIYSWDDGRIEALKMLKNKIRIGDYSELSNISNTMKWDDGRTEVLNIIGDNIGKNTNDSTITNINNQSIDSKKSSTISKLVELCQTFKWSDAKLNVLIKGLENFSTINNSEFFQLLSCLSNDKDKLSLAKSIYKKVEDDVSGNMFFSKLSDHFLFNDDFVEIANFFNISSDMLGLFVKNRPEIYLTIDSSSDNDSFFCSGICTINGVTTINGLRIYKQQGSLIIHDKKISLLNDITRVKVVKNNALFNVILNRNTLIVRSGDSYSSLSF